MKKLFANPGIVAFVPLTYLFLLLMASGCQHGKDTTVQNGDTMQATPADVQIEKTNISNVSGYPQDMSLATAKARETMPEFLHALANPKPDQIHFSVLKRYRVGHSGFEDMWLVYLSFDGRDIRGNLANIPQYVRGIHYGDPDTVSPTNIRDWQYLDRGRLRGGFTIRAIYQNSSPAEKRQMLKDDEFTAADMVRNY